MLDPLELAPFVTIMFVQEYEGKLLNTSSVINSTRILVFIIRDLMDKSIYKQKYRELLEIQVHGT